ncbi:MAG: hypothetical protein U9M98_01550 [Patescibacteria group bacterium]|nr:hypothetical protein [Patescibacteria group bacterium]
MSRSKAVLSITLIISILLAPVVGWGAVPLQASKPVDSFNLEIDIENDGSITIRELEVGDLDISIPVDGEEVEMHLDGLQLRNISTRTLGKLLANYGIETEIPEFTLDPQQVRVLVGYGVEHLGLRKVSHGAWQELSLYINNTKSLEAGFADETLDLLLTEMRLRKEEAEMLRSFLLKGAGQLLVNLPKAETKPLFTDQVEAENNPPLNTVRVGATLSGTTSAGEIISVGGITFEEANKVLQGMGIPTRWPFLVANPLTILETETLIANAGRNGFRLESNNGHWAQIRWDQEGREALYNIAPVAFDLAEQYNYKLPVSAEEVATAASLAEVALPKTELVLTIHNSTAQVESSPKIKVGQVLTFELDKSGNILLNGVPAGTTFLDYNWLDYLGPVAVSWDGEAREVRYTADEVALPPIFVAEDAAVQAGEIAAKSFPNSPTLAEAPWSKLDNLLANTSLTGIVLTTAGEAPKELNLEYSAKSSIEPQTSVLPSLALDREGNIALGSDKAALNLTPYLEENGISLTEIASLVPLGIKDARLSVDSNQVGINLNGASNPIIGLRWDYGLRKNAFNTADKAFGVRNFVNLTTYGIADAIFPYWEETATEMVAGGRGFQWGIRVIMVENVEELPSSPAENLLKRLGITP